jgi:MFS family permease
MVAMARWFVAMRGRALAMASLGFALGEALLPLTFVALLTILPWRNLWVIAAMLVMLSIPLLLWLLKTERTPKSVSEESHAHGMSDRHWLRREVLGHRLFWFMAPALLGPSAFITAFFFQQVHLAEIKGWSHAGLVALFPLSTIVGVVATLVSGWAVDRFGTARLTPVYQLPLVAAFLVLSFAQTLSGAAVAMVIMSLTIGANSTVPSAFWAEFYGTRHLGSIKAMTTAVMVLGSAIGPGLTGVLIDYGIAFDDQMIGIAVYFIFASGMAWMGIRRAKHLLPAPS